MLRSCLTSVWFGFTLVVLAVLNLFVFDLPDEPRPAGEFAEVGEGVRMHYVEHAGKGPAIVYLHGMPGTQADFKPVANLLDGRRWISIDRPGYGDSTGGTQTMWEQAESVHTLLDRRGVRGATVVGHSYGGPLAFALALRHPADVGHIVTLAAAAGGNELSAMDTVNALAAKATHVPVVEQVLDIFASNMLLRVLSGGQVKTAFEPDPVAPEYKRLLQEYTLKDSDLLALSQNTLDYEKDVARVDTRIGSVRQPVVVMQGRGDLLVKPQYARVIARELPRAKLVMLDSGHMIGYAHPREVVRQILAVERR